MNLHLRTLRIASALLCSYCLFSCTDNGKSSAGADSGVGDADADPDSGADGEVCPIGQIECDGLCIDPLTDNNYCGASGLCERGIADAGDDGGLGTAGEVCELWSCFNGLCQCNPASDTDCDGTPNSHDQCPDDPDKIVPGSCGCGTSDLDSEGDGPDGGPDGEGVISDGVPDCVDICVGNDIIYGDTDGDGYCDEMDACPSLEGSPPDGCPPGVVCWNVGDLCWEDGVHCMVMNSVVVDGNGPGCNSRGAAVAATGCDAGTPPCG